ncbi:hypothetical protein B0H66DRAFT_97898 [Apodospora peruviana]|uniref:Uncharacterized protein n=1 Tax=Apodospora peruviana TaxID=516989 RepID=A0AAE0MHR3_9PEZI|nr:hypothetical protein B0H66DRAFT_97898 [Apodospora peruviana]
MACTYGGNSDMYGLGIRIAFYLQWFGTILASWIARTEVPGLRLANSFFIGATFLALIIQASYSAPTIRAVDIYITLLLTYGSYYYYVPVYLWRIVTMCNPFWDPSRWPRVPTTVLYRRLNLILLVAVTCFQMWFWTNGVKALGSGGDCQEYGFFFTQVPLHADLFIAVNIFFAVALLICCTASFAMDVGLVIPPRWMRKQERKFDRELERYDALGKDYPWRRELQFMQTVSNVTIATVVVVAVELTIQWNSLSEVNDVSTAGQTIPVVIAGGLLAHVLYVWVNPDHDRRIQRALHPHRHNKPRGPGSSTTTTTTSSSGTDPGGRPIRGFHAPLHDYIPPDRPFHPPMAGRPPPPPPAVAAAP